MRMRFCIVALLLLHGSSKRLSDSEQLQERLSSEEGLEGEWLGGTADPEHISTKFITRQCILDYVRTFTTVRQYYNFSNLTRVPSKKVLGKTVLWHNLNLTLDEGQSLEDALQARWDLSDQVYVTGFTGAPWTVSEAKQKLASIKDVILKYGFDTDTVKKDCKKTVHQVPENELKTCMLDVARGLQAGKWKSEKPDLPAVAKWKTRLAHEEVEQKRLVELLEHRIRLELEKKILKWTIPDEQDEEKKNSIKKLNKAALEKTKEEIKGTGFSFTHNKKMCEAELKSTTRAAGQEVLQRTLEEIQEPTEKVGGGKFGKCVEKWDGMCPEGTSPQAHRTVNKVRAATIVATAPAWGNAIGVTLGALIGCAAGPATMGVTCAVGVSMGVAAALSIPVEWPMAAVVAPLASIDMFPRCRCYPDVCKYDKEVHSCRMTPYPKSSDAKNPFRWLPYQGQKCVQMPGGQAEGDGKEPKCVMQACAAEDFQGFDEESELHGKLGWRGEDESVGGVYNCLSVDGTANSQLISVSEAPGLTNNTAYQRTYLFQKLRPPEVPEVRQVKRDWSSSHRGSSVSAEV
eukprot:CAMPEP_0197621408 /NCGR_PEP_ID=MMETSP1338-20131121/2009_1 /TAXON_ID=43686 ORGANISM="Pelagodinium beii, Strain RCC1491" /NCGR_SAMPLE_ID=MMETSP1338 /ASSEMBLY_ACC=CAM_ASM_000754 /LENGTH=571 /DNA_ID=CAMNT_0043190881 /DNA_START=94 /DNA_END=1809 /DNA_ORIENTATION=+